MDKMRFFDLNKDIRTGERVRVLMDMLMECIGASDDIKKGDFFEMVRAKVVAEQDAIRAMQEAALAGQKKVRKPRGKEAPQSLDDTYVSVSD